MRISINTILPSSRQSARWRQAERLACRKRQLNVFLRAEAHTHWNDRENKTAVFPPMSHCVSFLRYTARSRALKRSVRAFAEMPTDTDSPFWGAILSIENGAGKSGGSTALYTVPQHGLGRKNGGGSAIIRNYLRVLSDIIFCMLTSDVASCETEHILPRGLCWLLIWLLADFGQLKRIKICAA